MRTSKLGHLGLLAFTALSSAYHTRVDAQTATGPVRVSAAELAQAPYASTGIVDIVIGRNGYRGSGAVARDPRIVYTCGHNVFENGTWASTLRFARAWNASGDAPNSTYVTLRGYRQMSGYSDAVTRYGENSNQGFAADFAVGFGTSTSNFGAPLPTLIDGVAPLRSTSQKIILGYPAELDHNGQSGGHFQHRTGPFATASTVILNPFLNLNRIATGAGNSGGPALVSHNGVWTVAGILVAGSTSTAGVFGLNSAANNVATEAINAAGGGTTTPPAPNPPPSTPNPPPPTPTPNPPAPNPTPVVEKTLSNTQAVTLRDGNAAYVARHFAFAKLPTYITGVKLSLNVTTTYRGDLDVYLRSPSGRVRWVAEHNASDSATNLRITQADLTDSYTGSNPNGRWSLFLRDFYRGDIARYVNSSVTISSR